MNQIYKNFSNKKTFLSFFFNQNKNPLQYNGKGFELITLNL